MPALPEIAALLPPEVSAPVAAGLVVLCFFTSAVTAVAGIGGGVVLLTVLITLVPPTAAIPVHGVVQLGSNASRGWLMREHVRWTIFAPFALGSLIGAVLGARLFVALPVALLEAVIAIFVLWATWAPKLKPSGIPERGFFLVGAAGTFLTMFVGATGPFLAAFLSPDRLARDDVVSTHATCMTLQHTLKVIAFGFIGFAFVPWVALLAGMLAASVLGSVAGRHVLRRVPQRVFAVLFKTVLTLLALRLLYTAGAAWLATPAAG